jgi:hypothetical protein
MRQIFVEEGCVIIGHARLLELLNFCFHWLLEVADLIASKYLFFGGMFSHIRIHTMNNCVVS